MYNRIKALKKHNKMIYNMFKKTNSHRDLRKFKKIKPSYDSSSSDNSISSDSDFDSYLSSLSDWYHDKPLRR